MPRTTTCATRYGIDVLSGGPIDVLIVGGGLAGLTLARQLELRGGLRIAVVEPRAPDPARRRLGESLTEVSSEYLADLGMAEHLRREHVRKLGLRFFVGTGPMGQRGELGILGGGAPADALAQAIPPTWQVHRGRLEAALRTSLTCPIVPSRAEWTSSGVQVDGRPIQARWVVDATARGLAPAARTELGHGGRAAWFWTEQALDIDTLGLPARSAPGVRERSTVHLMGPGGWVWVIRLADGSTSVGWVEAQGPRRTQAEMLAFLADREPELCAALGTPLDFASAAWTAHRAPLVGEGLARIGDAAGFLDPLYSSGADLIAIGNRLVEDVVFGELSARRANVVFDQVRDQYTSLYRGVHDILPSPRAAMAKALWDQILYFGFLAQLARSERIERSLKDLLWHARSVVQLQQTVHQALVSWAGVDRQPAGVLDQSDFAPLTEVLARLSARPTGRALRQALGLNLRVLEELAVVIWARAQRAQGARVPAGPTNPYAVGSGGGVRAVEPQGPWLRQLEGAWG